MTTNIEAVIAKYRKGEKDTGSTEIQITQLTRDIQNLQNHLSAFKKDLHSRRGLMEKINKRRKLMRYLKEKNLDNYKQLITDLEIRG